MSYSCPACGLVVSERHLRQHLTKSRNPLCTAYLAETLDGILDDFSNEARLSEPAETSTPAPHSESDTTPGDIEGEFDEDLAAVSPFGDVFGDYNDFLPDDFADSDSGSFVAPTPFANSEFEDDTPLNEFEDDPELERPIDRGPALGTGEISDDDDEDEDDDEDIGLGGNPGASDQRKPSPSLDRNLAEERLRQRPHIVQYGNMAGRPLAALPDETTEQQQYGKAMDDNANIYAPFGSHMEWEIARWAKLRGPSSTAFSELLKIDGVCFFLTVLPLVILHLAKVQEALGLSFKNMSELNKIIDQHIPGRPVFQCHNIEIGGQTFEVHFHDIMECVKALYSDPAFAPYLTYAPERHYVDESLGTRMYHDMHTGEWWWSTQVSARLSILRVMWLILVIRGAWTATHGQAQLSFPSSFPPTKHS